MTKEIFLTGGTGLVGSYLAVRFLRAGWKITFLARSNKEETADSRVERALKFADPDLKIEPEQIEVIEGDITERLELKRRFDAICHSAASVSFRDSAAVSISFRERERDLIFKINHEGTKNILDFALKSGIPRIHYVGTAFVSGDRGGKIFEDELDCGQKFFNSYEESKFLSEKMIRENMGRLDITVYRPSIIVGEFESGRTPTFTGYYGVFRSFYFLRKRKCEEKVAAKKFLYKTLGIFLKENGFLSLPVDIFCDPTSTLNMAPIDFVADTIFSLTLKEKSAGKIFHIVGQESPTLESVFVNSLKNLFIEDFQIVDVTNPDAMALASSRASSKNRLLQAIQSKMKKEWGVYSPYICLKRDFDFRNLKDTLGNDFKPAPPVDEDFFGRLIKYASKEEFGKHD